MGRSRHNYYTGIFLLVILVHKDGTKAFFCLRIGALGPRCRGGKPKGMKEHAGQPGDISSFIPMAYSVDGMAGKEARAAEKRIASILVSKWDCPYSEMAWLSLSIVRLIPMLMCGSRSSAWKCRAPDDDDLFF